jgi:hypothetical protein
MFFYYNKSASASASAKKNSEPNRALILLSLLVPSVLSFYLMCMKRGAAT